MALKVIVAGLGARGREWTREVAADPACELAAGVEPDEAARRRAAAETGFAPARLFADLDEALARAECDAVVVATPADRHVAACASAIARGRAVLVEKPFATRLADAAHVVRLAAEKRVPVVVAQNYRYLRSFRAVRRLVSEGALGEVNHVACQYWRVPHEMAPWLARMEHSVLWGMGVHHLDALRHALGREVTGVAAESYTTGALPVGASMRVLLDFAGGARATYTASYESSGHEYFERGQEFYLRLAGARATLHVFHRWLVLCERGRWPRPVRRGKREVSEERLLLDQLARAVLHGEEPDASGRDNLQTMAVVEACLRSAAERRWVNPQELLEEVTGDK